MTPSHGAGYVPMLMLVVVWLSKGSTNEKMIVHFGIIPSPIYVIKFIYALPTVPKTLQINIFQ